MDEFDRLTERVSTLKGIGPKKAGILSKLGIESLNDLIGHYPRSYEDRREASSIAGLENGAVALIIGRIDLVVPGRRKFGRGSNLRLLVTDDSGSIEAVFFNASYLEKAAKTGLRCSMFGRVSENNGKLQMLHPDLDIGSEALSGGILPIYPLSSGISQNDMRRWIRKAMELAGSFREYLPQEILERNRLCSIDYALANIHFPTDLKKYQEAKFRLVFEELLYLQTGLLAAKKRTLEAGEGISFSRKADMLSFIDGLPFRLTGAQSKVAADIERDMESPKKMNRLVQGDVGSGKTVLAAAAIYKAAKSGYQAAMMAPTELLAKQHYTTLQKLFSDKGLRIGLLTSGIAPSIKKKLLEDLREGSIDVLVGTHALLQPGVKFARLGLVITDEQHRFGVRQRSVLTEKGISPDVLVMTATPIPRTLAVILYGDLDISVIDEMPAGRKKIVTTAIRGKERDLAYDFIKRQLEQGRQAYVVAPLIEDSEEMDVRSAGSLFRELGHKLKPYNTALMHGAMKQNEKDETMQCFADGNTDVLISTVVIEVGIDIPNAAVMLIENAERFGLAQLHQLRGRVGRGAEQSYCMLVTDADDGIAGERISTMVETDDGFLIAEKDLSLRGPGEFFGTRQHGVPELKIADLGKHFRVLETVRKEAELLLGKDPLLEAQENAGLKMRVENMFKGLENFNL